ncbi:MAG: hypothetical protein B7X06_01875 [Verrucomicrobia bacterium 21-51-4]|nr:MAG: hypothetical protein B7X06_01875 [Verrucomicrobia bacterium 21-51-4]
MHEDFSFDQPTKPGDKLNKGYKNFSVFQDRPYLEKFQGVLDLRELRKSGKDIETIVAYLNEFNAGDLNFSEDIGEVLKSYVERRDYILDEVFAQRLHIYDSDTVAGPAALKLVDALEKATSKTSMQSPTGAVALNYPRVEERVPWDAQYDTSRNVYRFTTHSHDPETLKQAQMQIAGLPDAFCLQEASGLVTVIVPREALRASPKPQPLTENDDSEFRS